MPGRAEISAETRDGLPQEPALFGAAHVGGFILLAMGDWWTDYIQLHTVFGAFVMGIATPQVQGGARICNPLQWISRYAGLGDVCLLLNEQSLGEPQVSAGLPFHDQLSEPQDGWRLLVLVPDEDQGDGLGGGERHEA